MPWHLSLLREPTIKNTLERYSPPAHLCLQAPSSFRDRGVFSMFGLMMQTPLLLSSILTHAAHSFPDVEIISRTPDKPDHVSNYDGVLQRSSELANALSSIGIKPGDRLETLAWNGYRHLELYYGISGMGDVCHTVNPRLFIEQIVYIINLYEDRMVFFDLTFVDLVKTLMPKCPNVEKWIYLGEAADAKAAGAGDFAS